MNRVLVSPERGLLASLGALVRPWRFGLLVSALLVVAAAFLELVPPILVRSIIDDHLVVGRAEGLLGLAFLYLAAAASGQALGALSGYIVAMVAQQVLHALRVQLFTHLQHLPASYYDRTPLGDIISRCTADIETIDTVFTTGVATLVTNVVRLVGIAGAMVFLSPVLAAASLLVLPPLVVITRVFQVRIREAERANRQAVGRTNAFLQESLRGVEVIQAFGKEHTFVMRLRGVLREVVAASNRSSKFSSLYPPVTAILASLAIASLLWTGTREPVIALGISVGTLTAFVLLLQQFIAPLTALGDEWQTLQGALSGAERVRSVLALPADESMPAGDASTGMAGGEPGIECDDLVFGYFPDEPVLRGVSLRVRPGEHVALVGRTGAGKTSIVHLLAGLYSPWSGRLLVGGSEPRSIPEDVRGSRVGVVPQVVQLFSGSVWDNLTLRDPSIPTSAVHEAATLAGAHAFIQGLPEGYETRLSGVGRGMGVRLSSGQQQLLALARALVHRPAVLLLDEATSEVDGASEAAIRSAIREHVLPTGTAVLTVAHRLATAREADRVIVIEKGQIVEEGAPQDLVRRGGRFAALLEMESAGWDWRTTS